MTARDLIKKTPRLQGQAFTRKDGSRGWNPIVSFGDEQTEKKFQDLVTPFAVRALEEKQGRVSS
jgi:hypothetical protein